EQPIADAGVPGEHEVEKRGEPHDPSCRKVEREQEPKLGRLVDRRGRHGDGQRERRQRPPKKGAARGGRNVEGPVFRHGAHSAALRSAPHPRSAGGARGAPSGWAGWNPTLAGFSHARALFFPGASRPSPATPLTSSSRNAPAGPSPSTSVAAEMIATSAR